MHCHSNFTEAFVLENLLSVLPYRTRSNFYQTAEGAEIDLLLEIPNKSEIRTIEVKCSLSAEPTKGFCYAREDVQPHKSFVVYAGQERCSLSKGVDTISLPEMRQLPQP